MDNLVKKLVKYLQVDFGGEENVMSHKRHTYIELSKLKRKASKVSVGGSILRFFEKEGFSLQSSGVRYVKDSEEYEIENVSEKSCEIAVRVYKRIFTQTTQNQP